MTHVLLINSSTRGGVHDGASDPGTPCLRRFPGLPGITDVAFVHAQGLARGDDRRAAARADAERGVDRLLAAAA